MTQDSLILFIFLPIAGAALMPVLDKIAKGLTDVLAVAVAAALVTVGVTLISPVRLYGALVQVLPGVLTQAQGLYLDSLSLLLILVIATIGFFVLIFSVEYMKHYGAKARYYALFLLMLAGMNGVVLSHDLFGIYVFLEVAACSSYALVAYGLEKPELEAAFKYLVLAAAASALILLGISLVYTRTGTLDLKAASDMLYMALAQGDKAVAFIALLFLAGFGLKMAMVPFHAWLPDAHPSAPAPISAMLSGVLIKASGVYALARVFYSVLGVQFAPQFGQALLVMGILSIVIASFLALVQTDYKRLLAYSSVTQVGYILLGFGIGTPLAFAGALYHLVNHATFKSLLFLTSGAAQQATGTRELNRMGGLAKRMPVTATTSVFGSLAIAGVPPFNGFFSKAVIIMAATVQARETGSTLSWVAVVVAVLFSLVTLAYFLKVQRKAFFGLLRDELAKVREVGFAMSFPMIALAVLCLVLGVTYPWLHQNLLGPAATVMTSLIAK